MVAARTVRLFASSSTPCLVKTHGTEEAAGEGFAFVCSHSEETRLQVNVQFNGEQLYVKLVDHFSSAKNKIKFED